MTEAALVDWATGLSQRIQQLASEGATHAMIDRYIEAKRTGDTVLVARILSEPRSPRSAQTTREDASVERALTNIRIVALRPEVNRLTGALLLRYVLFVLELSEQIVKTRADHANWESTTVVEAVGEHVRTAALQWLRAAADVKASA